jgi:hypothetical protein
MARNTDSNRIATAAELDAYIAEILSIVKNPTTRNKIEARIRTRANDFAVVSNVTVESMDVAVDTDAGTFVAKKVR